MNQHHMTWRVVYSLGEFAFFYMFYTKLNKHVRKISTRKTGEKRGKHLNNQFLAVPNGFLSVLVNPQTLKELKEAEVT